MWQKVVKFSIYALVFLMPLFWLPFSFEAFEFNKSYLLFILVSIGILAWLGKMIFQDKEIRFRRTPLDLFVLGFLAIMIFSALLSQDKVSSLLGFYGRFWPSLIGILSLGGFYFLITNNVSPSGKPLINADKKPINADKKIGINQPKSVSISGLIKTFLWSSFFVVLISYLSLFRAWPMISNKLSLLSDKLALPFVMLNRTFNPISGSLEGLSMFLAFISVVLIGILAFKKRGRKGSSLGLCLFLFAILGLLALIDFWPAWLSLFSALLLFLVLSFWKRIFREDVNRLSLPTLFLIISLIFLFFNPLKNLLGENPTLGNLPKENLLPQEMSWSIGYEGMKENLVLGSGIGTFHYTFSKFKPESFLETNLWQIRFDRSGSHIAETLGTTGILGILSYFLLIGMFLLVSLFVIQARNRRETIRETDAKFTENGSLQLPLLIAFIALLVGQFVYYQNITLAFSFWLFLGLAAASWQRNRGTTQNNTPKESLRDPTGQARNRAKETRKEKVFSFKDFPEVGLIFSVIFWVILFGFLFSYFTVAKFYLADTHYKDYLANPTQNLERLERAGKLADSRTVYHIALTRAYLQRLSQEMAKARPNNQVMATMVALAVQEGKRAQELSPNRVAAQETLGVVYRDIQGMAQGALDWGIRTFEEAIELEPKNPVLLTELGKLQVANNKLEKARDLFNRALELRSDYVDGGIQLAILEEREGKTEEAIARLENLIQQIPFSVEAHFQLGRLYYNAQDYDKAILQFQMALQLFPNHSNSLYSLGLIYERKGERENALVMFERVLQLNPGNEDVRKKIEELRK